MLPAQRQESKAEKKATNRATLFLRRIDDEEETNECSDEVSEAIVTSSLSGGVRGYKGLKSS